MTVGRRAALRALSVALCVAFAGVFVGACSRQPSPRALPVGHRVSLQFEIEERVSYRGQQPARSLSVSLAGEAAADGLVAARVISARLTQISADGDKSYLDTADTQPPATPSLRVRRALLGGMVDAPVSLEWSPTDGLVRLTGLRDSLTASRVAVRKQLAGTPAADELDAADAGLASLLDDANVVRVLRNAGLGPVPTDVETLHATIQRTAVVRADGRGMATIRLEGRGGADHDDSPVVQVDDRFMPDSDVSGSGGPSPGPTFGLVDLNSIQVAAETQYTRATWRPLRGSVTTSLRYARGFEAERRAAFTLVVRE